MSNMNYLESRAADLLDPAVACLACIAYWVALSSTAIAGFSTGPDFDHPPMSGLDCLSSGWPLFPVGWLANPLFLAAVGLLFTRHRLVALLLVSGALGLAWFWTYDFCWQFPPKLLMDGYNWWLRSMQVLAVGAFGSAALHYRETWKSLRNQGVRDVRQSG